MISKSLFVLSPRVSGLPPLQCGDGLQKGGRGEQQERVRDLHLRDTSPSRQGTWNKTHEGKWTTTPIWGRRSGRSIPQCPGRGASRPCLSAISPLAGGSQRSGFSSVQLCSALGKLQFPVLSLSRSRSFVFPFSLACSPASRGDRREVDGEEATGYSSSQCACPWRLKFPACWR